MRMASLGGWRIPAYSWFEGPISTTASNPLAAIASRNRRRRLPACGRSRPRARPRAPELMPGRYRVPRSGAPDGPGQTAPRGFRASAPQNSESAALVTPFETHSRKRPIIGFTWSGTRSWWKCPAPTVRPRNQSGRNSWTRLRSSHGRADDEEQRRDLHGQGCLLHVDVENATATRDEDLAGNPGEIIGDRGCPVRVVAGIEHAHGDELADLPVVVLVGRRSQPVEVPR